MDTRLPAMETELRVLQIELSIEAIQLYSKYGIDSIPKDFVEIYKLGERLSMLSDELNDAYGRD